ncbi:MAG: RAMP superfamily CRISPR-associated protein [Candidatus Methanomethylicia archaeon]
MPDYRDFDKINTIIRIEGILINETPLRIGSGREPPLGSLVDLEVVKISFYGNEIPYIPGSSLKGLFRSYVETILASKGRKIHNPWDMDVISEEAEKGDFCTVCGIFGNMKMASHIRVYDAYPKDGRFKKVQKSGIAIDRVFGSVMAGPFNEEIIAPGVEWKFRMDVINIDLCFEGEVVDERGNILKNLLKTLTSIGLNIGSRRSIGYGLIKLKDAKWYRYSIVDGELKLENEGVIK